MEKSTFNILRLLAFIVGSLAWAIISLAFLLPLINVPFEKTVSPTGQFLNGVFLNGVNSFGQLFFLVTFPRIIISFTIALGIIFLFYILVSKKIISNKKIVFLILLVLAVIPTALIFPKKILLINISSPPATSKVIYQYGIGGIDTRDSATIIFYSKASSEDIISFYDNQGPFKSNFRAAWFKQKEILQNNEHYQFSNDISFSLKNQKGDSFYFSRTSLDDQSYIVRFSKS